MVKEKIERINFLAKKSKEEGLSEEEKIEQTALRNEYRAEFKNNFAEQLSHVKIIEKNDKN